jgi:hypothetical protein
MIFIPKLVLCTIIFGLKRCLTNVKEYINIQGDLGVIMNLTKFVMQPSLHLHPFCGFKKIYFNFIKHSVVNIPDLTFVKFNQNHYVEISTKIQTKTMWVCIVGCITNYGRAIITRESPCTRK